MGPGAPGLTREEKVCKKKGGKNVEEKKPTPRAPPLMAAYVIFVAG